MEDEFNIQTRLRFLKMRELIDDVSKKTVLDMGVGENAISNGLNIGKLITLDGFKHLKPTIVCDLNKDKIPLKSNAVDTVIAGELIEHMISPVSFLKKCNSVLKIGGEVIISTPNVASLKNRFRVLLGLMPEYCAMAREDGCEDFQTHVKDFNFGYLKKLLAVSGFEITGKKTNGIIFHSKKIWPLWITPVSFGEILLVRAKKIKEI